MLILQNVIPCITEVVGDFLLTCTELPVGLHLVTRGTPCTKDCTFGREERGEWMGDRERRRRERGGELVHCTPPKHSLDYRHSLLLLLLLLSHFSRV